MRRDQIALQLWTVRRELAADRQGTLRAVRAAGYRAVELAGLGDVPAARLADELGAAELRVVASHEGIDRFRADPDAVVERLATLDCPRAIVPMMGEADRKSEASVRQFAGELGGLASRLAAAGIRVGYHNHDFEFRTRGGSTIWDILVEALPPAVELELDVYWAAVGGHDPVSLIRRHADRVRLLHMKDRAADQDERPEPRDAPAGSGVLPMPAIVEAARAAGVEWYVVEQDEPDDALADAAQGLRYLEGLARE